MDPNETLADLRNMFSLSHGDMETADVAAIRDRFDALDEWLSKGGFLPGDWNQLER